MEFDIELDATGLLCPEPVMLLHEKMPDMESGAVLKVRATDPSTTRDIPQFCRFLGHTLLEQHEEDKAFIYFIQKA
ncbi:MAG: sulfurtransferase TusA [Oleiphilaceae bacterium]|nr:sulfurtransferase TusA [Oleiphilaceae bacterium]